MSIAIPYDPFQPVWLVTFSGVNASLGPAKDLSSSLVSTVGIPAIKSVEIMTTSAITTTFNTYYKMQGYNAATDQYEDWHSEGEPLMSPPSGHTLTNISVITSWQDR